MFIRIETSSSTPIYRQISDQIRYQIASGALQQGAKLPSVRELAVNLAVNQNTVLKVYNELSREKILKIERGDGTYVSSGEPDMTAEQRKGVVADLLRSAVVQAVQLGVSSDEVKDLVQAEYGAVTAHKSKQ
ncbi:MAG: GntR family transcriptional regulator [Phycisphaeraceae bacterium]|nr:GntR family transcriptional regulator [Phycisphaeraceae bacterium]